MGYLKKHSKKQRKMKPKVGTKKTKRRYNKSTAKRRYNKSTIKRKNNKLSLKRRKYYKQRGGGIIMEKLKKMVNDAATLITINRNYNTGYDEILTDIQNELLHYRDFVGMPASGDDEKIKKLIPKIEERIAELGRELNVIELEINPEEESTESYHPPEAEEESTESYHPPEEEEEIYNP